MSEHSVYIRNVKMSPKKLRFLLDDIKKQTPTEAVHSLRYTTKKGADMLRKAISSALANAKNTMNVDESLLKFKTIFIEEGIKLKRFRAGGRGMAKPFRRKYSHIKVVLTTGSSTAVELVKPELVTTQLAEIVKEDGKKLKVSRRKVGIPTQKTSEKSSAKK